MLGARHWPIPGREQSTSVTRRQRLLHHEPTLELGPAASPLHQQPDISRDYGDSLSSSGVAVNIGSEGEEEDSPRGEPHQIQFPQHTLWTMYIILFRVFTYRADDDYDARNAVEMFGDICRCR